MVLREAGNELDIVEVVRAVLDTIRDIDIVAAIQVIIRDQGSPAPVGGGDTTI